MANAQPIEYGDFSKLDIRIGLVKSAERVSGSFKLIKLVVDLGPLGERQIIAGIGEAYAPEDLVGKKLPVLTNIKPKKMMGLVSQGMILAAGCEEGGKPVIMIPERDVQPGSKIC
ncbi:MAG: methionine--tRNA ligase subunit beta [Fervidicoccaceae archaeon]